MTDEELYVAWAGGERRAGAELVDRYLARMGRFFANKVGDPADTEDLVAETFERCATALGSFEERSLFRTYLYGIARNVLRDYIRGRVKEAQVDLLTVSVADMDPSPSVVVADRREQALLLTALQGIPVAYQLVIELSFFEEMSRAEIAQILEMPPGTVASRLRKGRELLHERMRALAADPALLESTLGGLKAWEESVDLGPETDD